MGGNSGGLRVGDSGGAVGSFRFGGFRFGLGWCIEEGEGGVAVLLVCHGHALYTQMDSISETLQLARPWRFSVMICMRFDAIRLSLSKEDQFFFCEYTSQELPSG